MTGPGRGPRGWARDFIMGARFAFSGGAEGWLRTGLSALGIGLAVAVLLLAASLPNMVSARAERVDDRDMGWTTPEDVPAGDDTVLFLYNDTTFRGDVVHGIVLRPEGGGAPVPPGLDSYPEPGGMVVSPALEAVLESADGELLRPRLDHPTVGTIGDEGLASPNELFYYLGSDELDPTTPGVFRTDTVGFHYHGEPMDPALLLLLVVGVTILLLPILIFVAVASRFGGERRDRRLAAMRLVGSDRSMTRRMAAAESLVGSVLGLAVGLGLFLAARPVVEGLEMFNIAAFSADVTPALPIAVAIVVGVPLLALLVALSAMRKLSIEPLGVMRKTAGVKRRLWWRLILPVIGLVALSPMAFSDEEFAGSDTDIALTIVGVTALLLGMSTLVPWLVEATARRIRGGPVAFQLAVRRIQLSGGSMARMVNGIATAVAGGLALLTLFSGIEGRFEITEKIPAGQQILMPISDGPMDRAEVETLTDELAGLDGVGQVVDLAQFEGAATDSWISLLVADCERLRVVAELERCVDGEAYTAVASDGYTGDPAGATAGTTMHFLDDVTGEPTEQTWTVPEPAGTGTLRTRWLGAFYSGLLVTPAAAQGLDLSRTRHDLWVAADTADADIEELVRNICEPNGWSVSVATGTMTDSRFTVIRNALLTGVCVLLILIGLSMLVGMLEQLQERRRLLSMLSAFGVRRATMAASLLWQTLLMLLAGLLLAVITGSVTGGVLSQNTGADWSIDWPDIGRLSGAVVVLLVVVTLAGLPVLWRLMRVDGIRTE